MFLFFRKLSWTQKANPFINTGTTTITNTNSRSGYYSIHPNKKWEILSNKSLNKNSLTNTSILEMIKTEFQRPSCKSHALWLILYNKMHTLSVGLIIRPSLLLILAAVQFPLAFIPSVRLFSSSDRISSEILIFWEIIFLSDAKSSHLKIHRKCCRIYLW